MKKLLYVLVGCLPLFVVQQGKGEKPTPSGRAEQTVLKNDSIYQVAAELTDQDGKKIPLSFYKGYPVLISMFYAHCASACPLLISKLKDIEAEVPEALRKDLRVLLISFDSKTDTASVLKGLAKQRGIDETRWRFTRAEETSVREIAALLNIQYRKMEGGEFNHTSVITLLDREGRISKRMEGMAEPTDAFVREVTLILKSKKL